MPDVMGTMDIAFPHLGIYLKDVPKIIQIGNFTIAWYGVILAASMLLAIALAARVGKMTGQNPDVYWDVSVEMIIFCILGARIYYVIFFWDSYKDNPIQILNLRGGGLAIYGGVIAGVLTLCLYSRRKHLNLLQVLDTAAYGLVFGQIIGRWANFMNREVFGRYTDSLFAMRIPAVMVRERDIDETIRAHMAAGTNYIQVHPTFLYESLWNLGLLALLFFMMKRKRFHGEITLLYFFGYGIGRAWIEAIRTDQLYIGHTTIPVSLVLGLAMAACSLVLWLTAMARIRNGSLAPLRSAPQETSAPQIAPQEAEAPHIAPLAADAPHIAPREAETLHSAPREAEEGTDQ